MNIVQSHVTVNINQSNDNNLSVSHKIDYSLVIISTSFIQINKTNSIDLSESEKSYLSVGHLKSASQTGAFKNELSSPVVAWHVIYGRVKRRQVVRVRRQAVAQTPVPTSSFVTPTSVISTQVISTPKITRSPTAFSITPTATRIIPSPTQTAVPEATSVGFPPVPRVNTPPYLNNPINFLTAEVNEPFVFFIPPNTFHDKEDGETPKLVLDMYDENGNVLPPNTWVKLNQQSQKLNGTPDAVGNTTIGLIVTDSDDAKSLLHVVIIRVVPENEAPRLYNHIDLIPLYIGQPLVYKVPYDTFNDKEDGPTPNLKLSMRTFNDTDISSKPWVTFDAQNQIIYALPYGEIIGKHEFLMIAYDTTGKKAIDAFEFHINPTTVKPNHIFGLELAADYKKFEESVSTRVKVCVEIGKYFSKYFNTSHKDIRVENYRKGSVILEWNFANIATNKTVVYDYKSKYVLGDTEEPVSEFKKDMDLYCPIRPDCSATKAWVNISEPKSTTPDPNVIGRVDDDDDGDWWEYTIIPAFVIAALIFIIGLIIIICIRCRRKNKLDKNEKVVFVQRKKPAVFREEYPMKETYGNQPLITPNEKAPLPPPAYPRSSTPTEDPSERLLSSDSSPSYQPPFDSGHEPAGSSRPPAASYRLPPPYVAP